MLDKHWTSSVGIAMSRMDVKKDSGIESSTILTCTVSLSSLVGDGVLSIQGQSSPLLVLSSFHHRGY